MKKLLLIIATIAIIFSVNGQSTIIKTEKTAKSAKYCLYNISEDRQHDCETIIDNIKITWVSPSKLQIKGTNVSTIDYTFDVVFYKTVADGVIYSVTGLAKGYSMGLLFTEQYVVLMVFTPDEDYVITYELENE